MPGLSIRPSSALLTAGQAVTFVAVDANNDAVQATWNLTTPIGSLSVATPAQQVAPPGVAPTPTSSSATYVAPSIVEAAQTVAVTAATATDVAGVCISLTPAAMTILPVAVQLYGGQAQQFEVIVASGSSDPEQIEWILSPKVGELDQTGLYTAPASIPDDGTLAVIAVSKRLGQQISASILLTPQPWRGLGTTVLAAYIFLVFCTIYLMIGLWPSEIPNLDALKADQAQAQSTLDKNTLALQAALGSTQQTQNPAGQTPQSGQTKPISPAPAAPAPLVDPAKQKASDTLFKKLSDDVTNGTASLKAASDRLTKATSTDLTTKMLGSLNREIDYICLVLLAGALGSFLHMAQSFSDFAGNRRLKSSWVWWYCFLPFVGAGLAVVLYAGLRGGLITVATTPTVKASDLNPYGLVAAAALAGMFSKAATKKLGEIFETAFQTSKGTQTSDPLTNRPPTASQPSIPPHAPGGTSAS